MARKHDILIKPQQGRIQLSSRLTKAMGLQPGDAIDFDFRGGETIIYRTQQAATPDFRGVCHQVLARSATLVVVWAAMARQLAGDEKVAWRAGAPADGYPGPALYLITRNNLLQQQCNQSK